MTGRYNNFDVMRLIAASMVIFSHSYDLLHLPAGDWFATTGQFGAAYLAVRVFFILSGFLIAKSAIESTSLDFWKKRLFRIMPALWVVVLITAFGIGPFFTRFTISEYLNKIETWTYLKNASAFWLQYDLPGVFDHYHHLHVVNGSLWTLFYELTFYVLVWLMALAGMLKSRWPSLIFWSFLFLIRLAFAVFPNPTLFTASLPFFREIGIGYRLDLVLDLGLFYLSGVVLYKFLPKGHLNLNLGLIALVLYVSSIFTAYYGLISYITLPIIVLFLGTNKHLIFTNPFHRIGDFSYGIYIYAFSIQQIFIELGKGYHWNPIVLSWVSLAATIPVAMASYRFIEKPALNLIRKKPATV